MIYCYKNKNGFSVLEVTLALGVITMGLLGVFSLVLQNLQAQSINKNYLVASMLAQEGVELVRNTRDTNFLHNDNGYNWKNGNGGSPDSDIVKDGTYAINFNSDINDIPDNVDDNGARIYFDSGNGIYNHTGGELTPYNRLITVVDRGEYVEVHSNVQWKERGRKHNYEVVTNLYNWW